jgi:hypothetical protein
MRDQKVLSWRSSQGKVSAAKPLRQTGRGLVDFKGNMSCLQTLRPCNTPRHFLTFQEKATRWSSSFKIKEDATEWWD